MKCSLIHNLARQGIDIEATLFENFDSRVPIHNATIGFNFQSLPTTGSKRTDDRVRGLLPPILKCEFRGSGLIGRVRVDALKR